MTHTYMYMASVWSVPLQQQCSTLAAVIRWLTKERAPYDQTPQITYPWWNAKRLYVTKLLKEALRRRATYQGLNLSSVWPSTCVLTFNPQETDSQSDRERDTHTDRRKKRKRGQKSQKKESTVPRSVMSPNLIFCSCSAFSPLFNTRLLPSFSTSGQQSY